MKRLIYAYFFFLVFEGALRKWFFPGLSDLFLLIRDPIVIWIYVLALSKGRFPLNPWVVSVLFLGALSGLTGFVFGDAGWKTVVFGIRTVCLHLPLAWIIPRVLTAGDCYRVGKCLLWIVPPMTVVMVAQFFMPSDSWINLAPGGLEDVGIMGAKGRFRPPGTFSFVTGVAQFFAICSAFYLSIFFHKKLIKNGIPLLIIGGFLILALPISISRLTLISSVLVLVAAIVATLTTQRASRGLAVALGMISLAMVVLSFIPVFDEAVETFNERWVASTVISEGGVQGTFSSRVLGPMTGAFTAVAKAPLFGHGVGLGTNVGANLSGGGTFYLGENEWQRLIMETGPILGFGQIAWRVLLTLSLLKFSFRSAREGNAYGLLFFAATAPVVLIGQWGQPTTLGFAVAGTGLTLALGQAHREARRKRVSRKTGRLPALEQTSPAGSTSVVQP